MNPSRNNKRETKDPNSRYQDEGSAVLVPSPQLPGLSQDNLSSDTNGASNNPKEDNTSKSLLKSKIPTAPTISLPKGGGAIRSIGEKFEVNPSNGTASITIPMKVSVGRSGLQPNLSLNYDSASGNGIFGLGWRLSGVDSITRKTSKGLPRYNDYGSDDEADVFLLAGSEDLVPLWKRDQTGNLLLGNNGQPQYDETQSNGYVVRPYAPRIVTVFNRIERWASLTDQQDIHWRVISPDNVTTIFGSSESSRIYDPSSASSGTSSRIFSWLQAETYDSYGNAMTFSYKREDSTNVAIAQAHELNRSVESRQANLYLKAIRYGNVIPNRDPSTWNAFSALSLPQNDQTWKYSVVFDFGEHSIQNPKPDDSGAWSCRSDPFSRYNPGYEIRTYRLCQRILMFNHFDELGVPDYLVSSLDFTYEENPTLTYLVAAEQAGYSGDVSAGQVPLRKTLPPLEFDYSRFPTDDELAQLQADDVNPDSIENLPLGMDGTNYRWVDLDGEGLSGILAFNQQSWYYKRNTSASNYSSPGLSSTSSDGTQIDSDSDSDSHKLTARFGPLETVDLGPFITASSMDMQIGDVNGNGKLDLISHVAGQWGYYERDEYESLGWTEFRPFPSFPSIKPDHNVQFIDLTGDGLADVLIYGDQVFTWYQSLGSDGYEGPELSMQNWDETNGPVCVFADSEQTIYLADMSGDGLADLCRIRNGDCCYWPQLGYGRFGPQVCFDNGPWADYYDRFDHRRVKLADIDGSGTSDLVYFDNDGANIYLNESGNRFSSSKKVFLSPIDNSTVVDVVDLLGNGTLCFVWSSPLFCDAPIPMRYVDIFQNKKPHLVNKITNNLGSETSIHYAPSTKFYLEDKQKGQPWITKLHFPVQCVESVETTDKISGNMFAARYRYAHGYYDGVEREFRGFARAEQTDFSNFLKLNTSPTNVSAAWNVPPVRTVTWFHTGAFFGYNTMSELLSKEYFGGSPDGSTQPANLVVLDHTIIPPECVQGVEQMEACRALKGRTLRTEVYSDDDSDLAHIPYSVQETNFTIVPTQPLQDANLHGIYFVHARETLSCSYERIVQDPRITHQIVLDVNAFGDVTKQLHISYGRQPGQSTLAAADAAKQETTTVLYQESDFTNSLNGDQYRAPAPCESRQYEILGLTPTGSNTRFQFDDLVANSFAAILSIPEIPFENESNPTIPSKRLVRQERSLYRANDLSGTLPVGVMQSLCLPGAYNKLSYTPGLFSKLFSRQKPDGSSQTLISTSEALSDQGYVDLDGNGNIWTASVHISYATHPTSATPAQELAEARSSFFLPKTFIDIFNNSTYVGYDGYVLFPITSRDPVGNIVSLVMDYRALKPATFTDPNGNRSAAAYDALGMLAGTAISGKPSDNIGDSLVGFVSDLSQDQLDGFLSNPTPVLAASLLGNATSRMVYDPLHMKAAGTPTYSAIISRETYVGAQPPLRGALFQISITYSDGFGRVVQEKTRTKPGPLTDGGPNVADRWIGSGWKVFDNKGNTVKQFEPFFDTSAAYQPNMILGVSSTLLYDPLNRVAAILRPDHAVEKTIYSPWFQQAFDVNDNVLLSDPRKDPDVGHLFTSIPSSEFLPSWYDARSTGGMGKAEQDAATKTVLHSNTPKTSYFDSMGRIFQIVTLTGSDTVTVTTDLDILGNPRVVRDGLSRQSLIADFDMCQRKIHSASIDSGNKWEFLDGADQISSSWNYRGFRFRFEYDGLRRHKNSWWLGSGATVEVLTTNIVYGEEYTASGNDVPEAHNLRGQVWKILDQSGLVMNTDYDWAGNLTRSSRQLAVNYKDVFDVSGATPLEDESVTSDTFDVLRRPIRSISADGTITSRTYNQSTRLDRMYVNTKGELDPQSDPSTWTPIVIDVQYNAKGQITSVTYGNGTKATRTYDQLLFRLQQLNTTRNDGSSIQNLTYTYDPFGNPVHINDAAQQTIFFRNTVVDPSNDYTYDAIYRVLIASGREHLGQTNGQPVAPDGSDNTHNATGNDAGDGNAMGLYQETYKYDVAGNLLSVSHQGSGAQSPGWTRVYSYNEPSLLEPGKVSNRLSQTSIGSSIETYKYEGSAGLTGNMTAMASLPLMSWDFTDQLKATSKQTVASGGAQIPETTYYVYTYNGQRVRKVTESQAGPNSQPTPVKMHERIYIGEYEIFRKYSASGSTSGGTSGSTSGSTAGGGAGSGTGSSVVSLTLERTTFHASTEYGHLADICSRTVGTDLGVPRQVRFQLHNHLGSATIELDDTGALLSYEEYFPFGSSSYKAAAGQTEVYKRFRFSGKELDTENGLYYFGARYYAPWLGRWTAPDPVMRPGSRYDYAANSFVRLVDLDGRDPTTTPSSNQPPTFSQLPDPIFRLPTPVGAGRFPQVDTWKTESKLTPATKLLGLELKEVAGDSKAQATLKLSIETPYTLSDYPKEPAFNKAKLNGSEDFKLKLDPKIVASFGVSATENFSTKTGAGENSTKIEGKIGLQVLLPRSLELYITGSLGRTVTDQKPGPGAPPSTSTQGSAAVSLVLPRNLSPNVPIAFGVVLNAPAASPFARLPPPPGQQASPLGGFSVLVTAMIGFDFKAGETKVRQADALDKTELGKKVVGAIETVPGGKELLDVKAEDIVKAATSTTLPKQYNASP